MKLVCIADTHNKHSQIKIPAGNILIHAGDFTEAGTKRESHDFFEWFSAQPHKHKIFICGNHDFYLENLSATELNQIIPHNITFLQDSGITIQGFNIWGSGVTPGDGNWAFNRSRGSEIRKHWNLIPRDTHILITHTPPYRIKDQLSNGTHLGCEELLKTIKTIQIPLHIFGHTHNNYGITKIAPTTFINASGLDEKYRVLHPPIEFEL